MTSTLATWVRGAVQPRRSEPFSPRSTGSVHCLTESPSDSRVLKLHDACELLADGFDGFDEHIGTYVAVVPRQSHESDTTDAEQFLDWLHESVELTDEQRDYLAAIQGRHTVELIAVKQRLAHMRFQQLVGQKARRAAELDTNRRLTLHLNPIHVWSRFDTRALLDENADVPATVMFYVIGPDVHTVVVSAAAEELLRDLESNGPTEIANLMRRIAKDQRNTLLDVVAELAESGVIALT